MPINLIAAATKRFGWRLIVQKGSQSRAWIREATIPFLAAVGFGVAGECLQKWPRFFEQNPPIYKWNPCGLIMAKRSPWLWAKRGIPRISAYAALAS